MIFLVRMDVDIPVSLPADVRERLVEREREYAQQLQRDGRWRELWRVVGQYANYSIFDVTGNDELHDLLAGLPLYPYMRISVTPLARHPSGI